VSRQQAAEGVDPIEARRVEPDAIPTFTTCAARFIRAHRRSWKNAKHARQWVRTLKTYARPVIGSKPVDAIDTQDILEILSPSWTTKTETAKRVQGRIENILDFAAAHRYRDALNPARWRGHLDMLLPKPSRVKTVVHHPAMPYTEVPAFMDELSENGSVSALALRFLILTATRTREVLEASWPEINLEAAVWTIPGPRMKGKAEHRVPLSDPVMADLEALPRIEGNPYLFPGARYGSPLSNMALLQLMRGMGYGVKGERGNYVPHGFRSSFRDWSGEVSSFPRDVAEMALAHVIENKVEAAYRRGDLFEKRRKMMGAWAVFLGLGRVGRKVVQIGHTA
jgi:integrase